MGGTAEISNAQVLAALCATCKNLCSQKDTIKQFCELGGLPITVEIVSKFTSSTSSRTNPPACARCAWQSATWRCDAPTSASLSSTGRQSHCCRGAQARPLRRRRPAVRGRLAQPQVHAEGGLPKGLELP